MKESWTNLSRGFPSGSAGLRKLIARAGPEERSSSNPQVSRVNLIEMDWQDNLITDTEGIRELIANTKTIAVLGIKTEAQAGQPAFYVPRYLHSAGFEILPVPVYYPDVVAILGQRIYRTLVEIPAEVDLVNVFRRPQDVPAHLQDMLEKKPKAVWMQSGISHHEVAEALAKAGIKVVQDRCLMVDHRYLCGQR
jgi:uncharacterized protein